MLLYLKVNGNTFWYEIRVLSLRAYIHILYILGYASEAIEVLCTGDEDGILIDDIFTKNPLYKIDENIPGNQNLF